MTDDVTAAADDALAAATSRLRAEREATEARNRDLEWLVARRADLAARLAAALAERRAIDADLTAVLATG